jgi:hypothetical protein
MACHSGGCDAPVHYADAPDAFTDRGWSYAAWKAVFHTAFLHVIGGGAK